MGARISPRTRKAEGEPVPIVDGGADSSVSLDGNTRVVADCGGVAPFRLVGPFRKKLSESGAPDQIESVALSPDASRVSYCSTQGNFDVWILDLIRQTKSRFTLTPRVDVSARWSPSGKEIAWGSVRGPVDIYVQPSDGSGEPKRVISGPDGAHKYPSRWSPDGSTLLLHVFGLTAGDDVYYAKRRADGAFDEPVAFLNTAFSEDAAQFSPDGRFVAYSSDKSGRREGYVRSFPMREASVRSRPMAATYHAGAATERRSST